MTLLHEVFKQRSSLKKLKKRPLTLVVFKEVTSTWSWKKICSGISSDGYTMPKSYFLVNLINKKFVPTYISPQGRRTATKIFGDIHLEFEAVMLRHYSR
jgi:hypothetical protein